MTTQVVTNTGTVHEPFMVGSQSTRAYLAIIAGRDVASAPFYVPARGNVRGGGNRNGPGRSPGGIPARGQFYYFAGTTPG